MMRIPYRFALRSQFLPSLLALAVVAGCTAATREAASVGAAPQGESSVQEAPQSAPASSAASTASPAPATRGATVEGITEYRLANDMQVLLFPDPTRPTTTVNVTYFVGSRHEGYGETGMAHLLEHLVFKGTPDHPEITEEITRRGGRANGTTSFDRTNYFQTFPASEENLEWSLEMEADRMVNSFVSAEDLESEMTVVRNEWERGENSPGNVLFKRTLAAAFDWHGYGRSTIGARSDIENVPIDRLQAFYRKYYQPDNAVVVISGKFDEEHALELVERTFGAIPRPDRSGDMQLFDTYTREPAQDGERRVTLRRVGDVQIVMAVYKIPSATHADTVPLDLLAHVLGNSPSGRLYKALVERGKAAGVDCSLFALREPGVLIASAEVRTGQSLNEVREILIDTLEGLADNPPTEEEVERARTANLKAVRLTLNDSTRVGIGLTEWVARGDWRMLFLYRDWLREASTEEVTRVASEYLLPSNRTVGMFLPEEEARRAQIPKAPDVETLVADYRGEEVEAPGEAFEGTVEGIEDRVVRTELPSGARVAMLPKGTRGGRVVATIRLRLGSEESLMGRRIAGQIAGSMLMRGTERLSRQELKDELDRLQASVRIGGGATGVSAGIETVREHLPEVLGLVAEVLREPAFDPEEFEELRRQWLAGIESRMSEPRAQASVAFSRHMSPWPTEHPFYTSTFEEDLADVGDAKVEDARRFHEDFYGTGPGTTIAVVGDFDPEEIEGVLAETLGDWTAPQPFERIAYSSRDVEAAAMELETPDKTNAVLFAGQNLAMRDDHPDYPAMVLGNYILGGGFLNSRFANRIRQQEGLSYSVGSSFSASSFDERGSFSFSSISAPENVDEVEAAFREELANALADGFTDEELESAKAGWLQSRQVARGTDGQLAGILAGNLYLDRTLEHDAELEARVEALTVEEVAAALRRHLEPQAFTVVRAGDFSGSEAPGS